ncbi:46322_t:CDS:2, partial [Gigaspora margarita]
MGGGAWPFLVGGVICLVNSDNERDLNLLNSQAILMNGRRLLRGTIGSIATIALQRGIPSKHESSARADYVPALCTHRPSLLPIEWLKVGQTWSFRGSKSRNKVSVGEPAEGSLKNE